MGFAIPFPNLNFTQTLPREEQAYLGIPRKRTFSFSEIRGSLILIEFLNIYCPGCELQAQILNEVYLSIEKDPGLKGKVKMIGIAAGNNQNEVENFKKEYRVPYPIFSDPKFDAHTAVGNPRTPFVIWVRRDAQRKSTVVSTHLGVLDSMKSALDETRAVLQYNLAQLKLQEGPIYACNLQMPPLSDEELQAKAKESMETSGGRVLEIKKIFLKDKDWFYVGKVDFGTYQKNLFAKLASREAICDVCHDTYFIYAFDSNGKVVEIVPIQLTKIQNLQWTKEDVERLRSRTVGRSILQSFDFNPQVDSVSGATITAVLIFDCLDKGKEIYEKMRKEGYIMR